jgi:KAP family P-loop domain
MLEYASTLLTVIPVAGGAAGKIAEKIGAQLSHQSLEDERKEIVNIMRASHRKVVVLIDDIDRLDRDEILSILKMVRLTANFPQIVYVLAFDDEMVARAAGQSFGGTANSGRQFLEKIVQYPFTIPAVGRKRLRNFIERRARDACANANITLDENEWKRFNDVAELCLLPRLVTPRQAIRYGNALTFALPMLRGEVNALDQILVEGLRVLFPELYGFVRDNSHLFVVEDMPTGPVRLHASGFTRVAPDSKSLISIAERVMPNTDIAECTAGAHLLDTLFGDPRRQGSISNARYFDRYFSYTTSPDDITDTELQVFVKFCGEELDDRAGALLKDLALRNVSVLIGRLRAFAGQLNRETTEKIARTLARHGTLFTSLAIPRSSGSRSEAGALIAELILNCPGTTEQRGVLALQILKESGSLPLALSVYRGLSGTAFADANVYHGDPGDPDSELLLPESTRVDLQASLAGRISISAKTLAPYEEFEAADALSLLVLWYHERPTELRAYVTDRIKNKPSEAAEILSVVGNAGLGTFSF